MNARDSYGEREAPLLHGIRSPDIKAGIHTPATYTVRQCVADWLDSLTLAPVTVAEYRGQAEKWIYPKLGATTKLKDFKATDADRFFKDLGKMLGKRSLMM